MDDQVQTMIENLHKNTGKSLEEWIDLVKKEKLEKHGQIVKWLKETHSFTHGFANLVAHKTLKSDAGSASDHEGLIQSQYKGKEHFLPVLNKLKNEINLFGKDVEFIPKKAYISVKRKKQFAMVIPATKTRFDIGINLKGQEASGVLALDTKTSGMISHRIELQSIEDLSSEVIDWLKKAYESAG
jgi:predicted transport protein